jgi:hypothetical protein
MDEFNFAFSLFGLLLGFTLVEVLGGVAKALKARRRIRVGWLTPLLSAFVMLDVLSFWSGAWGARSLIPVSYGMLFAGLMVTATYYLAASWIFPEALVDGVDLDAHYMEHRMIVLPGIWLCNVIPFSLLTWQSGQFPSGSAVAVIALYWLLIGVAIASGSRIINGVALSGLIAIYTASALL